MQKMMRWETLIQETVQMGGSLVFLSEDSPPNIGEWLKPLDEVFRYEIPVIKRCVRDLLQKKFNTRPQDMTFIFSSQEKYIAELNAVLQGQRVLLTEADISEGIEGEDSGNRNVDFIWSSCSLSNWKQVWKHIDSEWKGLSKLVDLKDSHQEPCLFLDRDDVVVKNVPYNNDPDKVELISGIEGLISSAHSKGYWVSLVTNQSGLGRGWVSWAQYQKVHQRMLQLLAQKGCWIDECVWSAFIDEDSVPYGRLFAGLRKPRNGMFQMVNSKLHVNMAKSLMVGDSASDLIAAFGAGVGRLCLFQSEKIEKERNQLLQFQKENASFDFEVVIELSDVKI